MSKAQDLSASTGVRLATRTAALAAAIAEVGSRSELPTQTDPLFLAIALYGEALVSHHNAIEACKKGLAK